MLHGSNLVAGFTSSLGAWKVSVPIGISLSSGKMLFVLGPNGSGKTTLLRTLAQLIPPLAGQVTGLKSIFLPSEIEVQEWTTAAVVCDVLQVSNHSFLENIKMVFGVTKLWDQPLHFLSAGERKKIFLACTLASPQKIIILDEPQNFLEVRSTLDLEALIKSESKKGRAFIISSHDLTWVSRFADADSVLIGLENKAVERGKTLDLLESPAAQKLFGVNMKVVKSGLVETSRIEA